VDFRWVLDGETTSYSRPSKVDFGWTSILWEDLAYL